jgi:hypothetical protein
MFLGVDVKTQGLSASADDAARLQGAVHRLKERLQRSRNAHPTSGSNGCHL